MPAGLTVSFSPPSLVTTNLPKKLVKFVPQNSPIVNLYNLMDLELSSFHFQSRFRFRFRCSLRGMAGISPKGVVVYHIFSENPKVSQIFASCSSRFSFQKEIGETDIN